MPAKIGVFLRCISEIGNNSPKYSMDELFGVSYVFVPPLNSLNDHCEDKDSVNCG